MFPGSLVEEYGYNAKYMNRFEKQSRSALTETNLMIQFVDGYTASLSEAEEFVNSERGLHIFNLIEVSNTFSIGYNMIATFRFGPSERCFVL